MARQRITKQLPLLLLELPLQEPQPEFLLPLQELFLQQEQLLLLLLELELILLILMLKLLVVLKLIPYLKEFLFL